MFPTCGVDVHTTACVFLLWGIPSISLILLQYCGYSVLYLFWGSVTRLNKYIINLFKLREETKPIYVNWYSLFKRYINVGLIWFHLLLIMVQDIGKETIKVFSFVTKFAVYRMWNKKWIHDSKTHRCCTLMRHIFFFSWTLDLAF